MGRRREFENKETKKTSVAKRKIVSLIISTVLILVSLLTVVIIGIIGVLPFKYMVALILTLLVLNSVFCFILVRNKKRKNS